MELNLAGRCTRRASADGKISIKLRLITEIRMILREFTVYDIMGTDNPRVIRTTVIKKSCEWFDPLTRWTLKRRKISFDNYSSVWRLLKFNSICFNVETVYDFDITRKTTDDFVILKLSTFFIGIRKMRIFRRIKITSSSTKKFLIKSISINLLFPEINK